MERIRQAVEQAARDRKTRVAKKPAADAPARAESAGAASRTARIEYTETRCIQVSPSVREHNRLVAAIPGHPLQDTYRMLRTRVQQELDAQGWNTIAVTSPTPGCGKSLMAVNLAISLALDEQHTALLVDADLRHPTVHEYFGYRPEYGLNDYLAEDIPLSSVLFHPDIDRLTVLPGREPILGSSEALRSPRLVSLLKEVRARYADRIVILDVPPVLTVDDALTISSHIDCVLMVAEFGGTSKEDLRKSFDLLEGVPIIGTVLNKVEKKAKAPY